MQQEQLEQIQINHEVTGYNIYNYTTPYETPPGHHRRCPVALEYIAETIALRKPTLPDKLVLING